MIPAREMSMIQAKKPKQGVWCPFCRDSLGESGTSCSGCGTGYHPACALELPSCAILGCEEELEPHELSELEPLQRVRPTHPNPLLKSALSAALQVVITLGALAAYVALRLYPIEQTFPYMLGVAGFTVVLMIVASFFVPKSAPRTR